MIDIIIPVKNDSSNLLRLLPKIVRNVKYKFFLAICYDEGDDITKYRNKKIQENEFFFDYLKKEIKPKRKMGHFTTIFK